MRTKPRTMARRVVPVLLLTSVAAVLCGCPPTYDPAIGDWLFNFSFLPIHISYGLTLHTDGTATPFESTIGSGALPGDWTWQTDGTHIWFYQQLDGDEYTLAGTLLSDETAYGNIYENDARNPTGQWQAAHDD